MGVISSILGGVGSVVGGIAASKSSKKANKLAQANAEANRQFATNMYDKGEALIQPEIGYGNTAEGAISGLLGLGTPAATDAANAGFKNYRDTSGYQFLMDQGLDAVTQNAAAKGAFQSGATAKALQTYGEGLADQTQNNYLSQLSNIANRGTAAKSSLIGQGQNLVGQITDTNNAASKAAQTNALNQGNIINGTIQQLGSSFATPGGSAFSALGNIFGKGA